MADSQRSQIGRSGAHMLHSLYDSRELTRNARAASPCSLSYWEREVDPDRTLDLAERARRAEHRKKAYFLDLARKSAKARAAKAGR